MIKKLKSYDHLICDKKKSKMFERRKKNTNSRIES